MPVYSRLKQDYINFILQATLDYYLNLHLKFGAILSKTYKDMTQPHMYQNVHCKLLQKSSVYRNSLYIRVYNSRNWVTQLERQLDTPLDPIASRGTFARHSVKYVNAWNNVVRTPWRNFLNLWKFSESVHVHVHSGGHITDTCTSDMAIL